MARPGEVHAPVEVLLDQPRSPVPTTPSVQSRALAQLMMNGVRPIGDRMRITRSPAVRWVGEAFDAGGWPPVRRGTRFRAVDENTQSGRVRGLWVTARGADE